MSSQIEIQLIAVLIAVACALPGVFLVLRRMAMMSDAIAHAMLPGIVLAFFLTHDISSPLLIVGAAVTGVLTSVLVEVLRRSRRVHEDAAIGLVFPALFSIGVLLISRYAGDVHLDLDSVLLGELAFAPFERLTVSGRDIGPKALYVAIAMLVINLLFIVTFFKELKLATFDAALAASLGFLPGVLHYALMGVVSITVVGAFDAVGSILVVALIVASPATAYLLVERLSSMLFVSAGVGAASALSGFWLAQALDASIAGSIAGCAGLLFFAALLLSPRHGLLAKGVARRALRLELAFATLTVHLLQHEGADEAGLECQASHLSEHINWTETFAARVVRRAERRRLITLGRDGDRISLTDRGRALARRQMRGGGADEGPDNPQNGATGWKNDIAPSPGTSLRG